VWVGYDDKTSIGKNETGARAALPIWISFMESALRDTPAEKFKVPQGITLVKVDLETGLPATGDGKETIWEAFSDGDFHFPTEKTSPKKEGTSSRETTRRILPEGKVDGP
jgi:penicillin-binding protein 1A